MKERLTITLDNELLKKVDSTIDGVNIRNRSHAIERLLSAVLEQNSPKKAVILAGGNTINTKQQSGVPKPMLMVKERPILEYVIKELKRNDITDILISIGKGGDKITRYFGDGTIFGVKINYIKEDSPKGTANATDLAKGLVGTSPFFVINGDNIFKINLQEMYRQHITTKAEVTIALYPTDITTGFGVTKLDGFKVTSFLEKPTDEKGKLISAGVYIFNQSIFNTIEREKSSHITLEKNIFPKLASSGDLYGYAFSSPWYPLDSKNIQESLKLLEKVADSLVKF
jgi:NDP-sugar pyrophosphorylase family protein